MLYNSGLLHLRGLPGGKLGTINNSQKKRFPGTLLLHIDIPKAAMASSRADGKVRCKVGLRQEMFAGMCMTIQTCVCQPDIARCVKTVLTARGWETGVCVAGSAQGHVGHVKGDTPAGTAGKQGKKSFHGDAVKRGLLS